jgi:hypothetical protein
MARMTRETAADILQRCKCAKGVQFHALDSDAVAALLREADVVKYRRPANANGSRARYFHAYLIRTAGREG